MKSVDQLVADVIEREGGFNDHPEDAGGPTKYGISLKYLRGRYQSATVEDVKALTTAMAAGFYKKDFFYGPRIDKLPAQLQPQMFDMVVNHGPSRAVKMLQKTLLIPEDGRVGPATCTAAAAAIEKYGFPVFSNHLVCLRKDFYRDIVKGDPEEVKFLKGWLSRADNFLLTQETDHGREQIRAG